MSNKEASKVLSSVDGIKWISNRGDSSPWPAEFDVSVSKIVLGSLGEENQCEVDEDVLEALRNVAARFPGLTHLYLWGIRNLEEIGGLPRKLQCVDVRKCKKLTTLDLPKKMDNLEELIFAECPELSEAPEIPEGGFPELLDLEIRDCLVRIPILRPGRRVSWKLRRMRDGRTFLAARGSRKSGIGRLN